MKRLLLSAAASHAIGYVNDTAETVLIQGDNGPVRVNKSDFDMDQAGDKTMKKFTGKDPTATDNGNGVASDVNVTGANGVLTTAAPSAPDFSAPQGEELPKDTLTGAAAPAVTTADQLLTMKQGSGKSAKYFIADGMGNKITGDRAKLLGIDENGYDSEEAAKAVQSRTEPSKAPTP